MPKELQKKKLKLLENKMRMQKKCLKKFRMPKSAGKT